ncbi:hypothetical protein CPB84DRAFT_1960428 [Gymnopilus junonius]|uniref:Uncharacterized protein n=1 Tax=Gymnopilus junonius TaxID=109634 RepID=A0A9P5NQU9_GYMJU|nr:hypothetical protein CPB84DRAFT_1960428 [Gymnopilus junonius]
MPRLIASMPSCSHTPPKLMLKELKFNRKTDNSSEKRTGETKRTTIIIIHYKRVRTGHGLKVVKKPCPTVTIDSVDLKRKVRYRLLVWGSQDGINQPFDQDELLTAPCPELQSVSQGYASGDEDAQERPEPERAPTPDPTSLYLPASQGFDSQDSTYEFSITAK